MALYGARSTPPIFSSAVLQTEIVESFFFHSRLTSLGYCSGGAIRTLLRPVVPYTLALLRSALGRFFDRWYFTYQRSSRGAVDPADDIPSPWQVILGFPWVTSTFRLASLACCSGGASLALLRPVVPYTLALSLVLSAGGVSGSGALTALLLVDQLPPYKYKAITWYSNEFPTGSNLGSTV